jgi:hypothetical protein
MEQVLPAMQRAGDRQKVLRAHGELVSDERLLVEAIDWRQIESVDGRILLHGENEQSGKKFSNAGSHNRQGLLHPVDARDGRNPSARRTEGEFLHSVA